MTWKNLKALETGRGGKTKGIRSFKSFVGNAIKKKQEQVGG